MAPDLNSVPPSPAPHNARYPPTSSSRRTSQLMAPPPPPITSPASSLPFSPSVNMVSNNLTVMDNTGVGVGPGPLRHPRPLTAADLHLQLEKEQEAVVNRLTRELSLLRQQSASVASTTSSTSTGIADATDHNANHLLSGASHPTPSQRHRSSSNLSTRSANTNATTTSGLTGVSGSTMYTTAGVAGSTVSGITPARDTVTPLSSHGRETLSRHNSVASSRRSEASSPSLASSFHQGDHFPNLHAPRQSSTSQYGYTQQTMSPGSNRTSTIPPNLGTTRFEETAYHRSELEAAKRENGTLRRRIRELERTLSRRQQSAMGRERSESVSTSASVGGEGGSGRRMIKEDDEEVVRVGESAGSVGFDGGQ